MPAKMLALMPRQRLRKPQPLAPHQMNGSPFTTAIPWGCPTSHWCRRRTPWGWTTSRSTRAMTDEGNTVKVSPGKIQRSGVKTELVGKRQIGRNIHAPGVIELDERRITVVAPRFDGFIDTVGPVTSGTHVRKGDPLMTVFGQELLNQAARLLVEPVRVRTRHQSWQTYIGRAAPAAQLRCARGIHRSRSSATGRCPTPSTGRPHAMAWFSSATPSMARASRPATCCSASPTIRWCGSWRMSPRATLVR